MNRGVISFLFIFFLFISTVQTNGLQKDLSVQVGDQFEFSNWTEQLTFINGTYMPGPQEEVLLSYEITAIDTANNLISYETLNQNTKESYALIESPDLWGSKVIYTDYEYWRSQFDNEVFQTNPVNFDFIDSECEFGFNMNWLWTEVFANGSNSYNRDIYQVYNRAGVLQFHQFSEYINYNNGTEYYDYLYTQNMNISYCQPSENPQITSSDDQALFGVQSSTPSLSATLPAFEIYYILSLGLILPFQKRREDKKSAKQS